MPDIVAHFGMRDGPVLCGAADGPRWTTIKYVTCRYCQNAIDLFLGENFDKLIALRTIARGIEERKRAEPEPRR